MKHARPAVCLLALFAAVSAARAAPGPATKKELLERFRKAHELMDVDALMELVNASHQPESVLEQLRGRFSESVKNDLAKVSLVESARRTELKLDYLDAAARPAAVFPLEDKEGVYYISLPAFAASERVPIRTKTPGPQGALNDGDLINACRAAHEDGRIEALLDLVRVGPEGDAARGLIRDALRAAAGRELIAVELHPLASSEASDGRNPWKPYARLRFHWNGGPPAPQFSRMMVVIKEKRRFLDVSPE